MAIGPEPAADRGRAPFVYRRRVAFAETDLAGIVHFSMFFRYMEEAEHAMWREAGLSIAPAGADYGFPRVNASFEYRQPLRFEDTFEVHLAIRHASARSIRYQADIRRGEDVVAVGTMTMVCVRKAPGQPMRAMAFPDHVRRALGL